jgi:hypothetical protein
MHPFRALHIAVRKHYSLGIQKLLEKKIDTEIVDQHGNTAFISVAERLRNLHPRSRKSIIPDFNRKNLSKHMETLKCVVMLGELTNLRTVFERVTDPSMDVL